MTLAEADRRASDLVRDVPAVVGTDLTALRPEYVTSRDCVSEPLLEPTGQEGTIHSVELGGPPIPDVERVSEEEVRSFAEQRGFAVSSWDRRPSGAVRALYEAEDGFLLTVEIDPRGLVSVTATSPCVWPNGTPP